MRRVVLVLTAAFGIALALVLGLRLETASLSVVVGVLCGIAAGLPVSAALLYLFWRERQERLRLEEEQWRRQERATPASPPVIVLNADPGRRPDMFSHRPLLGERHQREFTIVGQEEMGEG